MDVTPRELRDVEIREAFRGYNRDEVNDLLERAAAAIEGLNERVRVLNERLNTEGEPASGGAARGETEDMLHRTLLLAQRAADEAIAEAQDKAAAMVEDAETRSRRMLADAAIEARRTTESERHRLEQEIKELQTRRELLSTDVDGLEHFETEYRSRLTSAMEADLHAIERDLESIRARSASAPGEKPTFTDDAGGPATMEVDVRSYLDDRPRPLVGSGNGGSTESETPPAPPAPEPDEVAPVSASATESTDTKDDAPDAGDGTTIDLFGEEQAASEAAALDDDSFFASLRDAVRDDAPLGPRDATERAFFDQDDSKEAPTFREAFKRRR